MFFLLSKTLWMLTAPVTLLMLLVLCGALMGCFGRGGAARAGRGLTLAGVVALLLCGTLPLGTLLLRPLEDRFSRLPDTPPPDGIIVLGGSTDQAIAATRGRVTIVDAADRMTEAVVLARRYPAARLVFTGGSNALAGSDLTEETVIAWAKTRVASYKCPKRVEFRDELARTSTGKLQKFKLRAPYWEDHERQIN